MSNVTDFKIAKRRQTRRRMFKIVLLILAILVGTYLLSVMVNSPNFVGMASIKDMIKGGPGFPIDAPGGKVKGMYQNGSNLSVLNETTLYFYNSSGSKIESIQHRMGNPQVATNGNMLLNYDRGSKTYVAYNRNNAFFNGKTDNAIRCGDISANGCIAIATQLENAQTQVKVLDEKQRERYTWTSDNAVTALAISDNGNLVTIGASFAEDGALKNAVTLLKNGKELFRIELQNELVLALEFDGNNVRCITDRSAILFGPSGKILGKFEYKGQQLAGFSMHDKGVALVFGDYEQDRQYILASVADDFFTLNATTTLTDNLQKICAHENTILVLGGSSFNQYSAHDCTLLNEDVKESSTNAYYNLIPIGNSIYAMTPSEIVRLPLCEPSRLSLFSGNKPQKFPENEEPHQSQEELDILEGIMSGMKDAENEEDETEDESMFPPVIGESQESDEESEVIVKPRDPEGDDQNVNQEPGHIAVQNENSRPSIEKEDDLKGKQPEKDSARRPAAEPSDKEDKAEKAEKEDSADIKEETEKEPTTQKPTDKEKEKESSTQEKEENSPLFASRKPE